MIELLLSILFVIGEIKFIFHIYGLQFPIDPVIPLILFLYLFLTYKVYKNQFSFKNFDAQLNPVLILFVFWGLMIISVLWIPVYKYPLIKILYFFINILIIILTINLNINLKLFVQLLFPLATILNVILFFLNQIILFTSFTTSRGFYLLVSEVAAIIVVLGILFYQIIATNKFEKILLFIIITINFLIVVFNTARGTLLFIIIFFILYYMTHFDIIIKIKNIRIILLSLAILIVGNYLLYWQYPEFYIFVIHRLSKLFEIFSSKHTVTDVSVFQRLEYLRFSFDKIFNSNFFNFLFGYGTGSFGYYYSGSDMKLYPHNMFIEILFDMGLIGFLVFMLFLFSIIVHLMSRKKLILLLIVLVPFLDAMKSFSITDLRILFFLLGFINNPEVHRQINNDMTFS
jgi:O-antigen ligase